MAGYLKKYISKYRVKADYNLATNDFIRDKDGNLDKSFDDYYIPCSNNSKIRHYQQKILLYYCPSIGRFKNILKKIYEDEIGDIEKYQIVKISDKGNKIITTSYEEIYKELLDKEILIDIIEFDDEGEFKFKVDKIDYIAKLVGAKTSGASISPFSPKNLPSKKYNIPPEELALYKEITSVLDKNELLIINKIQNQFDSVIQAKKGKLYDINAKRKLSCLSGKEYIHSIGLFNDYLEFLRAGILTYQKEKKVC